MQNKHRINAIFKTNKCPEFYPCTDGTFTDKTGKGSCSQHGGMLIIGKKKAAKKKTPAKKKPAKKKPSTDLSVFNFQGTTVTRLQEVEAELYRKGFNVSADYTKMTITVKGGDLILLSKIIDSHLRTDINIPIKKPDHKPTKTPVKPTRTKPKPKPKKQIEPKSDNKLKVGNVFWAIDNERTKESYNPSKKYFAYSGLMDKAMYVDEKNKLTGMLVDIKNLANIRIEKTNLTQTYKRDISNVNYTVSDALRISNFKWKKPKQSKIPFFEPINLHKYFKNIPSQNESQVAMTGIHYFDGGIVMTDAHKLLKIEYPFNSYEQYSKKSQDIGLEGKIVNKAGNLIDENYPNFNAVIPDYQDSKPVNIVKLYNYLTLLIKLQGLNPYTNQIVCKINNKPKGLNAKLLLELVTALCKINNSETAWNLHYKNDERKGSVSSIQFELNYEEANITGTIKGLLMPVMLDLRDETPYSGGMDMDYNRQFNLYYDFDDDNVKMGDKIINLQNPSEYINGMKKRHRINAIFKTNPNAKFYPCKDGMFTDKTGKGACSGHGGMLIMKPGLKKVYKLMSNKKYEDFVKQLGVLASDIKVRAILSSGLLDGDKADEKLKTRTHYIDVKKLIPTQNEIDVDKSLKFALGAKFPTTEAMLKGRVEIVAPVVVLNDKYILDGHHRWSQAYALNKNAKLSVISLYGNIAPQEMLKAIQIAIAREIGEVPIEIVQGVNLLTVSNKDIADAVYNYTSDKGLDLMVKYGKIKHPDRAEAVKYILKNVESMRRTSQPIDKASDRSYMPQTPYAKNWLKNTTDGSNNYKYPFVKKHRINAIFKTNKCPEFYPCKDGTFTDKTGKGACSQHGGMLIIGKEKTNRPKKERIKTATTTKKITFLEGQYVRTINLPAKYEFGGKMLNNPYVNKIGKVVHVQPNDIRVEFSDGSTLGFLEENLSFVSNTAPEEYRLEFEKLSKARQKNVLKERKPKEDTKDYFEHYTEIKSKSKPAAKLYNEMQDDFENWEGDTDKLSEWQEKFRKINWDFDIGMDGEAFDFRPIKVIQKSAEELTKDTGKVLKYNGNPIKIVYDKQTVDDYPYGRLRTTVYYSTEFVKNKGMRTVFQSINPKTGRVNKEKKSTYSDLYVMYRNLTNNYVHYFVFNLFSLGDCVKMLKLIKEYKVRLTAEQTDYLNFKILALFKAELTATINYTYGGYSATEEETKYIKENGPLLYLWLSEVRDTEGINKAFSRVLESTKTGLEGKSILAYLPILEKIEFDKYKYETLEKARRYFEVKKEMYRKTLEKHIAKKEAAKKKAAKKKPAKKTPAKKKAAKKKPAKKDITGKKILQGNNELWKSILKKFLKEFYGDYEYQTWEDYINKNKIDSNQTKTKEGGYGWDGRPLKYGRAVSFDDAYDVFYSNLTKDEKKIIKITRDSEEIWDDEDHRQNEERVTHSIIVTRIDKDSVSGIGTADYNTKYTSYINSKR